MGFTAFSKHILIYNPQWVNIILFWASIAPMISMIRWQCHSCYYHYCYYYYVLLLLSLFLLSLLFSWCAVLMNTLGLCELVVMRVLSDFYWTAATGAGLFTSNSAKRHADHCVRAARAFCWERVSLTWIPVGIECWSIRSGKYPWCSDLSLCGKNMHWMKRFVLLICKLSPGVVTLFHFLPKLSGMGPWDLPLLVTGLGGVCPTISVKNLVEVMQNYHL